MLGKLQYYVITFYLILIDKLHLNDVVETAPSKKFSYKFIPC